LVQVDAHAVAWGEALRIEGLPGAVHGAIAARAIHWFVPTMGPLGAWLTCGDVRVEDADATPLPVMFARDVRACVVNHALPALGLRSREALLEAWATQPR
jgi:hypothetical protein